MIAATAPVEPIAEMEGTFITNPKFQKASICFKYNEELSDTAISEDYDEDMFFEGPKTINNLRELPNYIEILQQ